MKLRLVDTASAGVPAYWALAACQTRGPFRATGARLPGSPGMRLGSEADWCLPIAAEPDIEAAEELRRSGQDTAKIRAQRSSTRGGEFPYIGRTRPHARGKFIFSCAPVSRRVLPPRWRGRLRRPAGGACGAWVAGGL